jgi:SAM-dependent methyltransferase
MKSPFVQRALTLGDAYAAQLDADARHYWAENRRRIAAAVGEVAEVLRGPLSDRRPARIIDVGPSLETVLLGQLFPDVILETMGWADHRYQSSGVAAHHPLDLNATVDPAKVPQPEPCDLILFLEVVEHLHTAPIFALRYLRTCLRAGGYLLVSTPNAAFLRNRWRLLCGRNPFEPLREDLRNPGHFREYTAAEFGRLLDEAGFARVALRRENLYDFGSASGRLASRLAEWMPGSFRHDMLFVAQRRE